MEMNPAASERTPLVTSHAIRKARRSLRVLVADDNLVNQILALRLLEKVGDTVVLASDGREAVDTLKKGVFDVILMDLQMPVLGGIEATAVIREQEKTTGVHIHIIALTAHAMKGDSDRCLDAGMDGYLSKPIQSQKLYELLDAVQTRV
jgi:CheY-like chemotaxis protein